MFMGRGRANVAVAQPDRDHEHNKDDLDGRPNHRVANQLEQRAKERRGAVVEPSEDSGSSDS